MKKINLLLLFVGLLTSTQAQVGINTSIPFSTLDVKTEPSGTIADGIIAPNLKLSELIARNALYTANQSGAFVYITAIDGTPAGKTINVITEGYYYYDGRNSVWKHFNDKLQTADNGLSLGTTANVQLGGNLNKPTTIDIQNKTLTIDNTGSTTETGLKITGGAGDKKVLTSDADGNATWQTPGFSEFTNISEQSSGIINYTNNAANFSMYYTGINILFPSPGTYLVTLGIYIQDNDAQNRDYYIQLMPTNDPADWSSRTNRYKGSYEAMAIHSVSTALTAPRVYYSETLTIPEGRERAYLMLAVNNTGSLTIKLGEMTGSGNAQNTGGSFVRIN